MDCAEQGVGLNDPFQLRIFYPRMLESGFQSVSQDNLFSATGKKKKNHILVLRLSFVFEVINNYHEAQLLRITVKYKKILLKRRKAR